jgi:hypothetical protein
MDKWFKERDKKKNGCVNRLLQKNNDLTNKNIPFLSLKI